METSTKVKRATLHQRLLEEEFKDLLVIPSHYNSREIIHDRNRKTLFITGVTSKPLHDISEYCVVPGTLVPEALTRRGIKKTLGYQVIYFKE